MAKVIVWYINISATDVINVDEVPMAFDENNGKMWHQSYFKNHNCSPKVTFFSRTCLLWGWHQLKKWCWFSRKWQCYEALPACVVVHCNKKGGIETTMKLWIQKCLQTRTCGFSPKYWSWMQYLLVKRKLRRCSTQADVTLQCRCV